LKAKRISTAQKDDRPKMSPTHARREERRQAQLELIQEQIKAGTLAVRQMTREERKKFPPRPRPKKKRAWSGF
jgi:hypothetical protein